MGSDDEKQDQIEKHTENPESRPVAPGEFTKKFGPLSANAAPKDLNASSENQPPAAAQSGLASYPGTLPELLARQNQVPLKPLDPQSDTYSRMFGSQALNYDRVPSFTSESREPGGKAVSDVSVFANPPVPELPRIAAKEVVNPGSEIEVQPLLYGVSSQSGKPDKATELFSLQESTAERPVQPGVPSDYTRVINSSALRSAEQNREESAPVANNPSSASPAPVAPQVVAPQWPVASVPASPIYPPAYTPQQGMPMPMPAVAPMVWPQASSLPAAASSPSVPQLQPQPSEPTFEQKWITYRPVIIGLNLLLLLALIFILIVVWSSR